MFHNSAGLHLSWQQKQLFLRDPAGSAHVAIRIEGPVDSARLARAFDQVVERHEILRTIYERSAGMALPFQVVTGSVCPQVQAGLDTNDGKSVFTIHVPALSADSRSLCLLAQELGAAYAEQAMEPAFQYADYAAWQAELPESDDAAAARSFWLSRDCAGFPALVLPSQKKETSKERQSVAVNTAGANPDKLLAAWQALLWRLSGQTEITVGFVVPNRAHDEFAQAVGAYEKIIPLSVSFSDEISFDDVIQRSRQLQEEIAAWADYYLPDSTEDGLTVGFSVEQPSETILVDGVTFAAAVAGVLRPFALELRSQTDGSAKLIYDPASFAQADAERLARRLEILLAAAPHTLACELPLMDAEEREWLLRGVNQTFAEYPRTLCVQQLFEQRAAETPNAPALQFEDTVLTYSELNARANRLSGALRARGVKANVPVGLLSERSADMIVGLLGIIKAGGCYIPLAPDHPQARLEQQVAEAAAPVVLTQRGLAEFAGKTLYFDDPDVQSSSPENPTLGNTPNDLVYVIYTSGSTGTPKGVAVTHRNLVNYSTFVLRRTGAERWNFATVSTLGADLGNTCVFPALLSGGCLHVISFETSMSPSAYTAYSAANSIDVLKITPSHLTALLDGADAGVLPRRFLISGGEALSWDLFQRISASGCQVMNHYGPTEATVGCCTYLPSNTNAEQANSLTVPVGFPISNAEVYVLDSRLQPVPAGTAGELCVAGDGIAQGYLNRPQETAERFLKHPFSGDSTQRIYRTGDLARLLPDGAIEFLGRIDQQVKIRGFRVEPAEIEKSLRQLPGVRQAVVVAEDSAGGKSLAAFVAASKRLETAEWRRLLGEKLPEYMLPSRLVWVDEIPLTANGKVDTRALAALDSGQLAPATHTEAPRNSEEQQMFGIWSEVLKTDQIGIHDNFFELGGHSLLATQIIARIRKVFGKQVPLHVFLQTPTIASLASKLAEYPAIESEEATLARLLQELDGISEEEAQALLAAEMGTSGV